MAKTTRGLDALLGKAPVIKAVPTATAQPTPTTVPPTPPTTTGRGLGGLIGETPKQETITVNYPIVGPTELGPQVPAAARPSSSYIAPPDIMEARRALQTQERAAKREGVPSGTVEYIVSGEKPNAAIEFLGKTINFDILGRVPFTDINLPGSFKPVKKLLGPLSTLDVGRRAVLSTLIETGNVVGGLRGKESQKVYTEGTSGKTGFSFSDWLKQTNDLTLGYGKIVGSPTGNKWIDRLIGFAGDVALDPITYVSGPGGIAKTLEQKAAITGAVKLETKAAQRTAALIARDVAADAARQAEATAARVAVDVAASAADKAAAREAADILVRAEQQANAALRKATGKVAAEAPRRTYGAGAREALAEQARLIRQEAQQIVDDAAEAAAAGVAYGDPAAAAAAQAAVNALTDDVILKINNQGYAGIRGAAAEVLGVQGGLRFFNPASAFGIGPSKFIIPGTEQLTNIGGRAIAGARLGLVATPLGQRVLNNITPLGEGGLYGADEISRMRIGLRGGKILDPLTGQSRKITAQEATDFTTLLSQDKFYRGLLDLNRKKSASSIGAVVNNKNFKKVFPSIVNHLQVPKTQWTARGLAPLNEVQQAAYDAVKGVLERFYGQADLAATELGVGALPKLPDFFPRAQTQQAFEWASKEPAAATKLADELGVDKTFFLGNFTERKLVPGKLWFGKTLDGTETVADLNRIAKESGIINFNYFEEDIPKALAAYANNHARYLAYAESIRDLAEKSPAELGGLAQRIPTEEILGTKPSAAGLGTLESTVANFMAPGRLVDWSEAQILNIKNKIDDLAAQLSASDINKADFEEAVLAIDENILEIDRLIKAGILDPTAGALAKNELDNYANALANQISNVKGEFMVSDPARWKTISKVVEDGFVELNKRTIPDFAVREDIAQMFKNVKRLDDPKFAAAAEALLKDYNTFLKSYATLSPGFQSRNALSNLMAMLTAGANPNNIRRGMKIYRAWEKAAKAGLTPAEFIDEAVARGLIKETEAEAVNLALAYSGATGFGQIGEIGAVAGTTKPGFLGREATGQLPFAGKTLPGTNVVIPETASPLAKRASEIAGIPIAKSRKLGTKIEDFNRFGLTLDGLLKGFDPQTAAARTQKFLFDYNDITKLDKNLRQLRPFWIWISRNTPLQIENMWMNPRAYAAYNSFRRSFEDKEGTSPYLPQYYKEQGAFKIPDIPTGVSPAVAGLLGALYGGAIGGPIGAAVGGVGGVAAGAPLSGPNAYFAPDFGFPGAGKPSLIGEIVSPKQFLSSLTPPLRGLLETLADEKFFSGAPIVSKDAVNPEAEKVAYYFRELAPPVGFFRRIANATPARRAEIVRDILGISEPTAGEDPATKELQSLIQFFGAPGFKLRPAQERSEIWRRFFQLQDEIDRARARNK